MATPVVAGSAALVRSYFMKGFYPTGAAVTANIYATPSGVLVKAVMMAGAAPMKVKKNLNDKEGKQSLATIYCLEIC